MATNHMAAYVRFRPMPPGEVSSWDVDYANSTVKSNNPSNPRNHHFSAVFCESSSNTEVYERAVKALVDETLLGKNTCVLCYGQTESGKTHTIFGYDEPGLVQLSAQQIFSHIQQYRKSTRYRVAFSMFEMYNETVNDLLNPTTKSLAVREASNGVAFADGLTIRIVHDPRSMEQLIQYGNENKTVGYSYLHDKSSRGHTVVTVQIASERKVKDAVLTQLSHINFVDLAGSEMLAYQFGSAQQEETKSINLSLLALRNVVTALASKEKFVSYRDSVLTRLLAPSLSHNAMMAVICTCSGKAEHTTLTQATLHFGDISRTVEQLATMNEFIREAGKKLTLREKPDETVVDLDELAKTKKSRGSVPDSTAVSATSISTRQGAVNCYAGEPSHAAPGRIALLLHAYGGGCSGRDWIPLLKVLGDLGYTSYAPDFPGFGETPGKRQTSRTERLDEQGGPMEIVYDVFDHITGGNRSKKVLVIGWDWGGNMGLSLALSPLRQRCTGLALYHPSWTDKIELLHGIALPVLLLWVPSDQLHLFSVGRRMARIIPRSQLISLVSKPGSSAEVWPVMAAKITDWIGKTILPSSKETKRRQPTLPAESPANDHPEAEKSEEESEEEDDDEDSFSTQSSFLACILCDPLAAAEIVQRRVVANKGEPQEEKEVEFSLGSTRGKPTAPLELLRWSTEQLQRLMAHPEGMATAFDALLRRNSRGNMRPQVLSLLGYLAPLLPHCPLQQLRAYWNVLPRGSPFDAAKYAPGRVVMVPLPDVCTSIVSFSQFGFPSHHSSRPFLTFRGRISPEATSSRCLVRLPASCEGGAGFVDVPVSWQAVADWNEPTVFPQCGRMDGTALQFEDAIVCRYTETLTKVKLAQIAVCLAPIAAQMDFAAAVAERVSGVSTTENAKLLSLQISAVKAVRGCMDMIHHVQMGKDPQRMCVPDCGRLAAHGQWHCHGMASVLAALLLPFGEALGIEVRYRDGFFFNPERDVAGSGWDGTPRPIADHTWLELTFLPSGLSCVCDPSFDDMSARNTLKTYEDAYRYMFPVRDLTTGLAKPLGNVNFDGRLAPLQLSIDSFM